MSYYFAKSLDLPIEQAVEKTVAALKSHGFGVLTKIDVQATLKEKIGVAFHPYVILGACDPKMAFQALTAEDKIGTMLPCNVVVADLGNGKTEIAAIDPVASMQAVDNPRLKEIAQQVAGMLKRIVEGL